VLSIPLVKLIELEPDAVAVDNNVRLPVGTCAKASNIRDGVIVVISKCHYFTPYILIMPSSMLLELNLKITAFMAEVVLQ
jgi:hypothetical protein